VAVARLERRRLCIEFKVSSEIKPLLTIELKYFSEGRPVIEEGSASAVLVCASTKPSTILFSGLGVSITTKVMIDRAARRYGGVLHSVLLGDSMSRRR
jgi:hypothetical protein